MAVTVIMMKGYYIAIHLLVTSGLFIIGFILNWNVIQMMRNITLTIKRSLIDEVINIQCWVACIQVITIGPILVCVLVLQIFYDYDFPNMNQNVTDSTNVTMMQLNDSDITDLSNITQLMLSDDYNNSDTTNITELIHSYQFEYNI